MEETSLEIGKMYRFGKFRFKMRLRNGVGVIDIAINDAENMLRIAPDENASIGKIELNIMPNNLTPKYEQSSIKNTCRNGFEKLFKK